MALSPGGNKTYKPKKPTYKKPSKYTKRKSTVDLGGMTEYLGIANPRKIIPTKEVENIHVAAALGDPRYGGSGLPKPPGSPPGPGGNGGGGGGGGRWGGGGGGGGAAAAQKAAWDGFIAKAMEALGGMKAPPKVDPRFAAADVNKAVNADLAASNKAWAGVPTWDSNPFQGRSVQAVNLDPRMAVLIAAQGGDMGQYQEDVDLGQAYLNQEADNWQRYTDAAADNLTAEQGQYKADVGLGKAQSASNIAAQRAAMLTAAKAEATRAKNESARMQAEHTNQVLAQLIQMFQTGLGMNQDVSKLDISRFI